VSVPAQGILNRLFDLRTTICILLGLVPYRSKQDNLYSTAHLVNIPSHAPCFKLAWATLGWAPAQQ
jgi:hypothetical protein